MRNRGVCRRTFVFVVVLLCAQTASAHLQGTWSGTIQVNEACDFSGGTRAVSWTSPARFLISETGEDFVGNVVIERVPEFDSNCAITSNTFQFTFSIIGASSSPVAFQGTAIGIDREAFPVSGSVNGTAMTLTIANQMTATLTQTDNQAPSSANSGQYSGSYTATASCPNGQFTTTGAMNGALFQTGNELTGTLMVTEQRHTDQDPQGNCFFHDVPKSIPVFLNATIAGSAIQGFLVPFDVNDSGQQGGNEVLPFTGTIAGSTISGSVSQTGGGAPFSFALNRTSSTPGPIITEFRADPPGASAGQAVTLRWSTVSATSVSIDNGVGPQPLTGSVTVRPSVTTTYTLTATGSGGSATATATVTIGATGGSHVVVSNPPRGFVQRAGEGGGSDTFTLSNLGEGPASITLTASGNFFTVSPSTFSIAAGASQIITINGTPQPAGSYQGHVDVAGAGVPGGTVVRVQMLAATPPSGRVDPRPTEARTEVSSQQGQGASGTVGFTNHGTATLQGIAVSDVLWIVPQSGIVTIPAGQTVPVAFTIDASKRPGDAPIGALAGKMSLVYIGGTGSNLRWGTLGNGAGSSSVSVTLVHVARPNVAQGAPPPLQPGERALFVSGVSAAPRVSDLILSNPSTSSVGDVRLYFSGLPGEAQSAILPTLQPNHVIAFPAVVKTVFGAPTASGSAQVRAPDVSRISIAATHLRTSAPSGTYGTALPVLHSDRGVGAGGQIVLPGVIRSAGLQTDLVVQELTGNAASFQVDFLNTTGGVVGSLAQQGLTAFAFARFEDVVPSDAAAARIRNVSAGSARIAAYALIETAAGDGWVVTDPATEGSATDVLIVPVISAGPDAKTSLFLTNRNEAIGTASIDVRAAAPTRRRAVSRGTSSGSLPPEAEATSTLNLAPLATGAVPVPSVPGYVRITAPSGVIAASARTFRAANGEYFGSGLPVVSAAAALMNGQLKRFPGLEDAASSTRAAATPATFRTNLILIEAAGQPAVVRVTLHYSFAMSSLASGQARSAKEFTLAAGQFVQVTDLARQVIGSERDSFGDLRNMSADIEVVSGSGRVLPFLHMVDNGSGDSIMRTE